MKKVVAACIDQILLFDSIKEFEAYEEVLKYKKQIYVVKKIDHLENGQCKVRIHKQYNDTCLID